MSRDERAAIAPQHRKVAEQVYTATAFDYQRDPIGSRDWTQFWKGWQAAAAHYSQQQRQNVLEKLHQFLSSCDKCGKVAAENVLCDECLKDNPDSRAQANWKEAVIDACVVNHLSWDENDPRKTLANLLSWECKVALDPAVSKEAADLIERGRAQAAPAPIIEQLNKLREQHRQSPAVNSFYCKELQCQVCATFELAIKTVREAAAPSAPAPNEHCPLCFGTGSWEEGKVCECVAGRS
jgi:hypothetical protein